MGTGSLIFWILSIFWILFAFAAGFAWGGFVGDAIGFARGVRAMRSRR